MRLSLQIIKELPPVRIMNWRNRLTQTGKTTPITSPNHAKTPDHLAMIGVFNYLHGGAEEN